MTEYDIGFARKLAEVAQALVRDQAEDTNARRTVAYLSRLSIEISLKALLEKAGATVPHSHDLHALFNKVCNCEVQDEITTGSSSWCSAMRFRAKIVPAHENLTVSTVIEANVGFPTAHRYGNRLKEFDPEVLASTAFVVVDWCTQNLGKIRLPSTK